MRAARIPVEGYIAPIVVSTRAQIAGLVLLGLAVAGVGLWNVHERQKEARLRDALCASRLETVAARSPIVVKGLVRTTRPCWDLAGVAPDLVPER